MSRRTHGTGVAATWAGSESPARPGQRKEPVDTAQTPFIAPMANPATCAAGSEALRSKVQHITLLRGCRKGRQAPSYLIRSGGPSKNPIGRLGGPKPSKYNPNPATCAAGSEALRSKVSLRVSPAAPKAQGKRVLAEKAGSASLFRQAGAAASRFRYHVPPVRFAHRNMMFPSLQGCSQPCSERPSACRRSEALRSKVSLHVSPAAPPGAGETCPGGKGRLRRPFSTSEKGRRSGPDCRISQTWYSIG